MTVPLWIDTDQAFRDCCRQLMTADRVAVDTEFIWTNTYYPKLALLQLATGREQCFLVDVPAVSDTSAFREFLETDTILKIFHEAASDLPILSRWCGGALPRNIYDTRIAGGFCGLTSGCSLNRLLSLILDILLPKTETRTDWLQRPLTDKQLQYAADDVILLPELSQQLDILIANAENTSCFQEEMQTFSQPDFYAEESPEEAWKRVGGAGRLNDRCRGILYELAKWREITARSQDRTRRRLATDEQLMAMAIRQPETLQKLGLIEEFWSKQVDKYGREILEAIKKGQNLSAAEIPPSLDCGIPSDFFRPRLDRITNLARKRAEARKIDPALVCPKRRASALVISAWKKQLKPDDIFFQTWQAKLLGPALNDILFS